MSFLPPADTAALANLLQVIADPKAAKDRLDQLKALGDSVDQQHTAVKDKLNEVTQKLQAHAEAAAKLTADKAAFENYVSTEKPRLQKIADEFNARTAELNDRVRRYNEETTAQLSELTARESTVTKREDQVSARENSVLAREQTVQKLEALFKVKAAKFKELTAGELT